ncbi:MAG: autotransporter outer membrane beta-barrel domain-containing protein [Bacteroidota bacterium]
MSKHCYLVLFILFLISSSVAQERQDLIYMKDGTILKGIIIENVPNDYVRVELPGGSLVTIKYSDIARFGKESSSGQQPARQTGPIMQNQLPPARQQQDERDNSPQFRKGVYRISGGVTYSSNTQETSSREYTQTTFSATPGFASFLVDGLLFGIDGSYSHTKFEDKNRYVFTPEIGNNYDYTSYGAGISLRYYAIPVHPIPFFGAQVAYGRTEDSEKQSFLNYAFELGLAFPISLTIGIEPFFQYGVTKSVDEDTIEDYKSSTISAGVRVAYYIFE